MATTHSQPKQMNQNAAGDVAFTPLASTRDAPFMIQVDDSSNSNNSTSIATMSDSRFANKLRAKTAILQSASMPETRSERTESTQSTAPVGAWNVGFASCLDCRATSCRCSDLLVLACCPCIPAAKVHGLLGSSFEVGVLYFGGLVFAILVSLGLSCSNTSGSNSNAASHSSPATGDNDRSVASDADSSTLVPNNASTAAPTLSVHIYGHLALVLLALFVVGVAFLRTKTRHRFNIPGSRALDCALSFACCWCVLSQTQRHLEKHNRHEFGLDTPVDTLPAFV